MQVFAMAGYEVIGIGREQEHLKASVASIERRLMSLVQKGRMPQEVKEATMARIHTSTRLEDVSDADLIEESVPEDLGVKKGLFAQLDRICKKEAIFGTNTSGLSVTDLAMATNRKDQVLGMHFHNPAPVMRLLELVRTIMADQGVIDAVRKFGESLGKTVVLAPDVGGFIVTRLFTPFLPGAIRMLESGIAKRDEIDNAMKLAVNHPMGPLEVVDFIGLDTELSIAQNLYDETKDSKYAPPLLLTKMVTAGWLGRKTGKGFYDYK
jgi:3-hydroxybutyryl-CoA dehydrogenase